MIDQILYTLSALLSFVVILKQFKTYSFWSSRGIKGPRPLPFIGTSYHYFFNHKTTIDQRWRQQYGKVYGIYEGSIPILRVSDPELVKDIWIKQFSLATDRNHKFIHGDTIKRMMFFSPGQIWANQRVLVSPVFSTGNMKKIYQSTSSCVDNFLDQIESWMRKIQEKNKLDLDRREVVKLTLDIIGRGFFGLRMDNYEEKKTEFYKRATDISTISLYRLALWLMTPVFVARYFKFDIFARSRFRYFESLSRNIIEERRKSDSRGQYNLVHAMIDAKIPDSGETIHSAEDDTDSHYNGHMTRLEMDKDINSRSADMKMRKFEDEDIEAQMVFFFIAGFDTTSTTISFCLYNLGHEQSVQEEVYQEIKSMNFELDSNGRPIIDYNQLLRLRKLDAFVSESLRLYSTVIDHQRMVTAEGGLNLKAEKPIHLPKGIVVSVPGFVMQRDPDYWPEPMKFDLSRFYPENKDRIVSCSYMPFEVGPRNCVGMRFALLNVRVTLAKLLAKYRVLPGPKSQESPPAFKTHTFFLQMKNEDFSLVPRINQNIPSIKVG